MNLFYGAWLDRVPDALSPGKSALDIGCGHGHDTRTLLAAGLHVVAHAGEEGGPEYVREALDVLRAKMVLTAVLLVGTVAGLMLVPSGDLLAYALTLFGAQAVAALAYGRASERGAGLVVKSRDFH